MARWVVSAAVGRGALLLVSFWRRRRIFRVHVVGSKISSKLSAARVLPLCRWLVWTCLGGVRRHWDGARVRRESGGFVVMGFSVVRLFSGWVWGWGRGGRRVDVLYVCNPDMCLVYIV